MMDQLGPVGPPTKKTEKNIRTARSHSLWMGPYHVEFKLWTGVCKPWPRWQGMVTEFFNEGPVYWVRIYWLTCGVSVYRLFADRRANPMARRQWQARQAQQWNEQLDDYWRVHEEKDSEHG